MTHWLTSLPNRLRPRRGWTPFMVVLGALVCSPAAVIWISRQRRSISFLAPLAPSAGPLLLLTSLAVLAGFRAAHSRQSRRMALSLSVILGLGLSATAVGRLTPSFSLIWNELTTLSAWLGVRQSAGMDKPLPFASAAELLGRRLGDFGTRLWWDVHTVVEGGSPWDTYAYVLLVLFLAWSLAFLAVWQIYRRKSALTGLLPSGLLLAILVLYYPGAVLYLILFLMCTLWLLAACNLWDHRDRWQATNTDYPDSLGLELSIYLAPWVLLLIVLAGLLPTRGFGGISRAFWEQAERLFGPLDGEQWNSPFGVGTLPRSHLLGAGPELGENVVLYVTTDDPRPVSPQLQGTGHTVPQVPRRYWRSDTYDVYTSNGWTTSPLVPRSSPADSPLFPDLPVGVDLSQRFQIVASDSDVLYGVNAPYRLDQAVQSWWRTPDDLARITSQADVYTVVSRVTQPTELALHTAHETLPSGVSDLYLTLPESVPRRVFDLAELVAGDSDTQFDKAQALETFLRTYTYTLELAEPPADRDLVDHFLFDLQRGYCDYYASAMVVMARAVGLPARLASGYTQGTYDLESERWVVTEQDAHSWVEIYFGGIGWVEFEPTASQPTLLRVGGSETPRPPVPPLPTRSVEWWHRIPWLPLVMVLVLLILIVFVARLWTSDRDTAFGSDQLVRERYARLAAWGVRLGAQLRVGQTANECGEAIAKELQARADKSRWAAVQDAAARAQSDVGSITEVFVRAQYGPAAISRDEGQHVVWLWSQLRRRLWRLWLDIP